MQAESLIARYQSLVRVVRRARVELLTATRASDARGRRRVRWRKRLCIDNLSVRPLSGKKAVDLALHPLVWRGASEGGLAGGSVGGTDSGSVGRAAANRSPAWRGSSRPICRAWVRPGPRARCGSSRGRSRRGGRSGIAREGEVSRRKLSNSLSPLFLLACHDSCDVDFGIIAGGLRSIRDDHIAFRRC